MICFYKPTNGFCGHDSDVITEGVEMSRWRVKRGKTSLSEESLAPLNPTPNALYTDGVVSASTLHRQGKMCTIVCSPFAQQNMCLKSCFGAVVQWKSVINVVNITPYTFHHFIHDHGVPSAHPCEWMSQEMKSVWTISNFRIPGF